jgi:hypothetical protein
MVLLGWETPRADYVASWGLFAPTGKWEFGGDDNGGLGMWSDDFQAGTTLRLDSKRAWTASLLATYEIDAKKSDTNIKVGDILTFEGGLGKSSAHHRRGRGAGGSITVWVRVPLLRTTRQNHAKYRGSEPRRAFCPPIVHELGARARIHSSSMLLGVWTVALLLSLSGAATAPTFVTRSFVGTVADATGSPLPGVTVTITGSELRAAVIITDADGRFDLGTLIMPGSGRFATTTLSGASTDPGEPVRSRCGWRLPA